jgi:hypothetical protein
VVIDRSSNTDSCLVLVLLLAAWSLSVAAERGSGPLLALATALVGIGFNVKMLAAVVVLSGVRARLLRGGAARLAAAARCPRTRCDTWRPRSVPSAGRWQRVTGSG